MYIDRNVKYTKEWKLKNGCVAISGGGDDVKLKERENEFKEITNSKINMIKL